MLYGFITNVVMILKKLQVCYQIMSVCFMLTDIFSNEQSVAGWISSLQFMNKSALSPLTTDVLVVKFFTAY